jgi:hypothetical protein
MIKTRLRHPFPDNLFQVSGNLFWQYHKGQNQYHRDKDRQKLQEVFEKLLIGRKLRGHKDNAPVLNIPLPSRFLKSVAFHRREY